MLKVLLISLITIGNAFPISASFRGRILKADQQKRSILIVVKDSNVKFFKRNDELFFYNELNPHYKCRGIVLTSNYTDVLIKVSEYSSCSKHVGFTIGSSVKLDSKDLAINLDMAKDVVDVLLKKKLILSSKVHRLQNEIGSREDKKSLVNSEYEERMSELKLQWREALENVGLEEQEARKQVNDAKLELIEIDKKLKLYNIENQRIQDSQWSLKYDVEK